MNVRLAHPADIDAIMAVNVAAFGRAEEAGLVEMLADNGDLMLSLVAEEEGAINGHVAFSRMAVTGDGRSWRAAALAPIAVRPDRQGAGLGSLLIELGLNMLRIEGLHACFVLGNPGYYGRFGFDAARAAPFASPYAGPHFMAVYLDRTLAIPQSGTAHHAPAFTRLESA